MDPSRYYAQPGPSSQYPQHQHQGNDRGDQMQVAPVDDQTVQQYITDLYRNPMRINSGPIGDPAFYAKAHQDLFNAKHRIEQMLLINQQHAELAQMATQIQHPPPIHPSHVAYVNAQVPAPHQHGAWAGSAPGSWTYQPHPAYQQQAYPQQPYHHQAYAQPIPQAYPGQFVPDVTMHDAAFQQAQSVPQIIQLDSPQQNSVPYHQPAHENPPSTQQHTVSLPNVRVRSQPVPQAAPSTSTNHAQSMDQPQPQPQPGQPTHSRGQQPAFAQGNPLQPGHQPNQAGSSTTQKVRETTQKQLHYLQLLAQQHQRKQQSRPSSHQSSPASSQVALPSVPPITNVNDTGDVPSHPVPQLAPTQRSSSPPQELPGSTTQVEIVATVNPSPAKIRSRKPFALHDLRPERRQSLVPSNASNTPSREMNTPANESANAPSSETATPSKGAKPADNARHGSSPAEARSSPKPSAQTTNGLMPSHDLLNTPSPLAQPAQIAAEPAPIPVDTTNSASEIPNASAPALNKPTESVPAPSSSTNAPKKSSAGSSKMKIALENLHIRGADCVALVRQAAQIAGVSVNNLPEETGRVDTSVPLFTPGQPLDVWTSNLQVTRQQGDAVVKGIWDLMKKKARDIGIDAEVLRHPPPEATTNGAPPENDPVAKYGNSIPSVSDVEVSSNSDNSAEPGASQRVTAVQQPHTTPSATKLSTEPRPPSIQPATQPPMQTVATPLPQASAASIPARPASTPVPPPQVARPAPVRQTSNIPPSTQPDLNPDLNPDPAAVQAQLAQRHQYNPYPNGTPPQPVYQIPEQQHSRVHTPAYVPPNLATQTQVPVQATRPQAPVQVSQPQPQSERTKTKPRKTAALDYLLALGVDISGEGAPGSSKSAPSKPVAAGSEPIQTKDKGKGKAIDVEEPAAPVQPEPSNNGNVTSRPIPPINVAGPSQTLEVPPSPIAPTIAVLPEPSPTPPSPLSTAETITRPMTPVAHSPVVVHAPTPLQASTSIIDALDMPVDTMPPLALAPESASATTQASAPTPAPVEAPPSSISAIPIVNSDSAPPVTSQDTMLSPPIASISTLTLNSQSSPAESTPLKRKRESRPSDVIEAGPGPNTQERARQQHAAGNKHDQKRPKVAKPDSTTTGVAKKSASSYPENPYPNIPRPDSPLPKNSWAQSYATAMNLANRTERPLFRPETPPSDMASSPLKSKPKHVKQRMIMEVVIPLRKKGKLAAEPSSMIDLTLSDNGTERDEDLGLDELVYDIHDDTRTEQEPDLKMLRRRLRPHTCEWEGCIGPPVLSSVELLGVHLNRHHLNCRDPDTGYYMCRWENCMLHFKNPRRLWSHISEKHVRHPLYCPYQDCDRTTSERYRMVVHVNRAHRGNADAKLRVFAQPEDFPPDRADPEEGVLLRPDAFPEGVPYFRTMGMALRYEVVPAQIPSQRHARIGPIILRNISAPTGLVCVPRQAAGSRAPELPLPQELLSPMPSRSQVRLGTVPPDALGEELEREAGPPPNRSPVRRITTAKGTKATESNGKAKANPSPARSHITITSDESSPERENRRGTTIRGHGRGRGRGGTSLGRADRPTVSQSSPLPPPKTPRLQVVVELPRRGSGSSSTRK